MNIDIAQIKADRKALDERILEAKQQLRSTWTRPMGAVQIELLTLKRQVTELHVLRAHARGRVHLAGHAGLCREIAERVAKRYQKEEAA